MTQRNADRAIAKRAERQRLAANSATGLGKGGKAMRRAMNTREKTAAAIMPTE